MEIYGKDSNRAQFVQALNEFRLARRDAVIGDLIARFFGVETNLISFEDIRQRLQAIERPNATLEDIPLNAIIGSVNRYEDFTRSFLPRAYKNGERWARVWTTFQSLSGFPPIDVYQIGGIYFVIDGNHRVSIARWQKWESIQAYVTKIETKAPLTPEDSYEEIILKVEHAHFIEKTSMDELRPELDLSLSSPGKYINILQQIEAIHARLALESEADTPYEDAVTFWCDEIYTPVAEIIRDRRILQEFPGRTEADLFLWIVAYRQELIRELGWDLSMEAVASSLADRLNSRGKRIRSMTRLVRKAITPNWLEKGSPPGEWRQEKLTNPSGKIFTSILVHITAEESEWSALDLAIDFAQREDSTIFGLFTMSKELAKQQQLWEGLREKFSERCKTAGIQSQLVVETDDPIRSMIDRGRWADLTVAPLKSSTARSKLSKPATRFSTLVQHSVTPVLLVPEMITPLKKLLLAYDGSLHAWEALFMAAYLAVFWELKLTVISAQKLTQADHQVSADPKSYLESYSIAAEFINVPTLADFSEYFIYAKRNTRFDLGVIGSSQSDPIIRTLVTLQSDGVLPAARIPALFCR